jgi:hypothetical protein
MTVTTCPVVSVALRSLFTRVMSLLKGSNVASRATTALLYSGGAAFTALIAFLALVEGVYKAVNLMPVFEGL